MSPREKIVRYAHIILRKLGLLPKNPFNYVKLARLVNINQLYSRIAGLNGCTVECGVGNGQSLALLKVLSVAEGRNRKIFGFDTFRGLPAPRPFELGILGQFRYSREWVLRFFQDTMTPTDNLMLVEGDITVTLRDFKEPIAFLHIDVDLYDGYRAALETLWDKLVPGGIVLLDDYRDKKWEGATQAVDEFIAKNNLKLHKSHFARKFYLVK